MRADSEILQYVISVAQQLTANLIGLGILMINQHLHPLHPWSVSVGQICQFNQLFFYELPWHRSSKNVRNHSADIIAPQPLKPLASRDDKTHCLLLTASSEQGRHRGGQLYRLLNTTKLLSINGAGTQGGNTVQCSLCDINTVSLSACLSLFLLSNALTLSAFLKLTLLSPFLFLLLFSLFSNAPFLSGLYLSHTLRHIIIYSVIMGGLREPNRVCLRAAYKLQC